MFRAAGEKKEQPWQYLQVEEGRYRHGEFKAGRILNRDQTGWGLVFATPAVLRVQLYTR